MSLWQEFDLLQKKKAELDNQLLSVSEKEKVLENRLKIIEAHAQEEMVENIHKLEAQLKEKYEAIGNLESKITQIEKILKKPVKELIDKEPVKEEPLKEPAKEKQEKQPVEVTTQAAANDSQPQAKKIWD